MIKLERPECPKPEALVQRDYKDPINKEALRSASFGKCMYCESEVEVTNYSDIEHFKPKHLYPDLEFEWTNLGYACGICNRKCKGTKFDDNLINPYEENPQEHLIALGSIIYPKSTSLKGEITSDIVQLNRKELVAKRAERLQDLLLLTNRYQKMPNGAHKEAVMEQINEECSDAREYSFVKKYVLSQVLENN